MILITAAGGMTGKALVERLIAEGEAVRALVSTESNRNSLESLGAEVLVGDLIDPIAIEKALSGIDAIYLMWPNFFEGEFSGATAIIERAVSNSQRIVYHSVFRPHIEEMPHHWEKMRVEEYLYKTHEDFVILQPCAYLDNFKKQLRTIQEKGKCNFPWGIQSSLSYVDLRDVAEVATLALHGEISSGASLELCGPQGLSGIEIARILSRELGRDIVAEAISPSVMVDDYSQACFEKMNEYYVKHGFSGSETVLERLLGRPARTFEEWLQNQDLV